VSGSGITCRAASDVSYLFSMPQDLCTCRVINWLIIVDCLLHVGGPSDRLMGIVIGVSISSGCIVICVIIILLRNRFGILR